MEADKTNKKTRAERRVKQIRGFHNHVTVFILMNSMLVVVKIIGTAYYGENFMGPIWHFSTFMVPLFWGIALGLHAMKVFNKIPFFNANWEKRQIQKYMEEEQKESDTYK